MRKGVARMRARADHEIPYPAEKRCCRCKEVKRASEFYTARAEKDGLKSYCKMCGAADRRNRYALNPQKGREAAARWRATHPEKIKEQHARRVVIVTEASLARHRASYYKHRAERLKKNKQRYEENKAAWSIRFAAYRMTLDPEKQAEYRRNYRKNNPDKMIALSNAARARKANAPGSHTTAEWLELKEYYGSCCAYCQAHESDCGPLTRDHMISLSNGGSDSIDNIAPCCKSCNSTKNVKSLLGFAMYRTDLQRLAA